MNLSEDQQRAFDAIVEWYEDPESPVRMSLGGYAGTGKTTVISHLLEELEVRMICVAVCAFTGKAASVLRSKGVPATTMHRLIYSPVRICRECDQEVEGKICRICQNSKSIRFEFVRAPMLSADLVIIDEASMLSSRLVEDLESFPNTKFLYVGDHGQLEPIGDDPGIMRRPDIRLEKIHRQAEGSPIIAFAHHLRTGGRPAAWTEQGDVTLRLGLGVQRDLDRYDMVLCGYNRTRCSVNRAIRKRKGITSTDPQEGERLVCLQNDKDLGLFNGMLVTIAKIRGVSDDIIVFDVIDDDGQRYYDVPAMLPQFGLEKKLDWIREVALFDFGYAMTVHKSQGSQWDSLAVLEEISPNWSADRWRYTAVTRAAKTLDYIIAPKRNP